MTAPICDDALAELSSGGREVLALFADERIDRGIAGLLFVTPKSVEPHVRSIFSNLDLPWDAMENRRVNAVLRFLRRRAPSAR